MKAGKLAWLRARLTLSYEASGIRHQASEENATDAIKDLFARPSIVVEKHGKKGPTELDIAPMIREVTAAPAICRPDEASACEMRNAKCKMQNESSEGRSAIVIDAVVAAQNPTLNPLLLVTAIETYLPEYKPDLVQCRRLEIYDADMKPFR